MSSIPEEIPHLAAATAANADELAEGTATVTPLLTETASGWDSYEVWRRFIKDARDRRLGDHK